MTPKERERLLWEKIENVESLLLKILKKMEAKSGKEKK